MGQRMRNVAAIALAILATGVSTAASAQAMRGGATRKGGQAEDSPGYEKIKKPEEKRFPLGASWVATSMNGKAFTGRERPSFTLDDQFRVRGFGGCNSFAATAFPLKEQGIAVGPVAVTRNTCDKALMDTEHAFLMALRTSAKWDSQVGTLIIKGPNGEMKFERSL